MDTASPSISPEQFAAALGGPQVPLVLDVRGADTDRLDLAPQSAGLSAVSLGLARLHADDHVMLGAALPLYDALYAWCRGAPGDTHGCNPGFLKGPAA